MSTHPKRTRITKSQISLELEGPNGEKYETREEAIEAGITGYGKLRLGLVALSALAVDMDDGNYTDAPQAPVNKSHLTHIVGVEQLRAEAAEGVIQSDVDQNEADGDSDRAAIRSEIAAAKLVDDAALATELARALAAEAAVQSDVDQNEADGDTDRASIRSEMASNETDRDASEALAIQTAINDLVDAAPGTLDTLNELAAAMADDPDFHSSMATVHASATTDRAAIRSEIAAAKIVDDAALASETARAVAAEGVIQSDVDQNEADGDTDRALIRSEFAAADTALAQDYNAQLETEAARAAAAEGANAEAISAEAVSRAADDVAIVATADALQADVDGNEADGDTDRALIRSEIAAAKLVDDAALATEVARALAAEAAVQSDVDQNEADGDTDRALIRSEIVAAKGVSDALHVALQADVDGNEADGDTDRALIRSEIAAAKLVDDAALATEVARALAAEAVVQADVDQNEADGDSDRAAIRSEMASNETDRDASEAAAIQAAVNSLIDAAPGTLDTLNELAAAMADDPDFHSSMATVHAAATTDRALIRTEALAEKGLKDATIAALQADVDGNEADGDTDRALIRSEIAAAKLVDDAALASEAARALLAEGAIQSDVDQNEADGDSDRAAIRSEIAAAKLVDDAALAAEVSLARSEETGLRTDVAAVQSKWKRHTFATRTTALAAGTQLLFAPQGHSPMSQISFISMNGLMMNKTEDYLEVLDSSGDVLGFSMVFALESGDSLSYFGEQALDLTPAA